MPLVHWSDSAAPNHILSAVSVFDRESGAVHVREQLLLERHVLLGR